MPMLLALRESEVAARRRSPAPTASAVRTCAAVPSGDALSTTVIVVGNGLVWPTSDSRHASISCDRVVGDDDDREAVPIGHRRPPRAPTASRRRRRPSRSGPARRRVAQHVLRARRRSVSSSAIAAAISSFDARWRDVARGGAAGFARHRRVQHDRRHAGGQRLERRQAEAFVFRQEREHRRALVQRRQRRIVHIRTNVDAIGVPATARESHRDRAAGCVRFSPTISSRASGTRSATQIERRDQSIDAAPLKIEPTYSTIGSRSSDDRPNDRLNDRSRSSERNDAHARSSMPMWRAISRLRELACR